MGYRWTPQKKQADVKGQAPPRLERVVNPKRCFVIILSLGHAAFALAQPVPQTPAVPVTADNYNRADVALFNGKPVVHTHMVVGLPDGTARAGHVLEAHVWPTLEVMVTVESNAMRKSLDPETGLSLIDPRLAANEEK